MLDEFHSPLLDNETWKLSMIAYRKWEQRRDRTTNPEMRQRFGKELARTYLALSNVGREIVIRSRRDGRVYNFAIKDDPDYPGKVWFRRNEHEPWFELGYWDAGRERWFDTIEERERPLAFTGKDAQNVHAMLSQPAGIDMYPRTDHVHFAMTDINPKNLAIAFNGATIKTEGIDMNGDDPEALESAAAHAMARAAELRAIDNREPSGEEPTISWTWTPDYEGAKTYTFVAFKSTDAGWFATGAQSMCRDGMTWRQLTNTKYGEALKTGNFLIVTEWSEVDA